MSRSSGRRPRGGLRPGSGLATAAGLAKAACLAMAACLIALLLTAGSAAGCVAPASQRARGDPGRAEHGPVGVCP